MYDFAVIGAGIAGASVAHFLAQEGRSVAILDASGLNPDKIQASRAAGAFLSPMFGKGDLKSFINKALKDALLFYGEHFAPQLVARGLLRLEKHLDRDFSNLGSTMDFPYERRGDGYFLPVGAMIDARGLLEGLTALSDVYDLDVQALHYDEQGGYYSFDGALLRQASGQDLGARDQSNAKVQGTQNAQDLSASGQDLSAKDPSASVQDLSRAAQSLRAKAVVLATGIYTLPGLDLLSLRGVWGERLAVEAPARVEHNVSKDVSVSATMADGLIVIGSTHVRGTAAFGLNKERAMGLLALAREQMGAFLDLSRARIVDVKYGIRPCSVDYYPIAGRVYDKHQILKHYPGIRHGARIPEHLLDFYPNLYTHTAHGGRGFASAIYTARALADFILRRAPLPYRINSARLVYKTLRRAANL